MIAKIVKGKGFRGVVNYVLDKEKQTQLLVAYGVRHKSRESIIRSFTLQAGMNPKVTKPVGHISLDFSMQDAGKLSNEQMIRIAADYMKQMGIVDTQCIIGRHYDKEHPHIHIVFNRVDNNGKTISDSNDRFRSEKICKELTQKYGLYFAKGKENVKEHRLKEPDKTKYEIYHALKSATGNCRNWQELGEGLKAMGIAMEFRYNGDTDKIQGVKFTKNGYSFNGSKIDRECSYSKINAQLRENNRQDQSVGINQSKQSVMAGNETEANNISMVESIGSALGSLFNMLSDQNVSGYDADQVEYLRQQNLRARKKKGRRL
jgi:hypothetical protein